jgi:hypothetical protein
MYNSIDCADIQLAEIRSLLQLRLNLRGYFRIAEAGSACAASVSRVFRATGKGREHEYQQGPTG